MTEADGIAEAERRIAGWQGVSSSPSVLLNLDGLALRGLPDSVRSAAKMRLLRGLSLGNNQLESLPEWIGEFRDLVTLYIDKNRITRLPESIGQLRALTILVASSNRLSALPASMQSMHELSVLHLQDNPDLGLPAEIVGNGRAGAILDHYFKTRTAQSRPLNEAKLVLIGRGGVGKTSLIDRIVLGRNFDPHRLRTEGVQITDWRLTLRDSEKVLLNVWDFGGQEIMHATHQFFLTERSLYLIVVNGRQGGEDSDIEYWLRHVESFGGNSPVIVVLNKIDSDPFDLNRSGLQQKYPERIRCFVTTDCATGTGLDELRRLIIRETDALPDLRMKFPESWFRVKARLGQLKENFLPFDQFQEICRQSGEDSSDSQENLAAILHWLGIALNYRDDPRLRDTHVLNPRWVTGGIYKILTSSLVEKNHGEVSLYDLAQILDSTEYPKHIHEFLLALMRKFELCFRFPHPRDEWFLVPQLLGKEQPAEAAGFAPADCLNFQYTYPVWPEGLLPRFIVRTHDLSTDLPRWRTGVILEFEGNRALVKAEPQDKQVLIAVAGPVESRKRLLAIIRSDLERIHADFPKLNPLAGVPVPQDPSVVIEYDELRAYDESKTNRFPKRVAGKVVQLEVQPLLSSVDLPTEPASVPVKIFISYSHKDRALRGRLEAHMKIFQRRGLIQTWSDTAIDPGAEWSKEIDQNLKDADLILLLVSADFLNSNYCYDLEAGYAMERHNQGAALVLPVIIRKCPWEGAHFAKLEVRPTKAKPVAAWTDRDAAWTDVVKGIEQAVAKIRERR